MSDGEMLFKCTIRFLKDNKCYNQFFENFKNRPVNFNWIKLDDGEPLVMLMELCQKLVPFYKDNNTAPPIISNAFLWSKTNEHREYWSYKAVKFRENFFNYKRELLTYYSEV